ncbi:anthocyanidin 3-O-glucosyltransferase 2 [Jatropha curcas]|nr:anthocyanidin 3-O-glucosyltransferase 2 [Jatropha curcas]
MEEAQLVFVPVPGMGHLISMVELAKLLLNRHHQLTITVLIMKLSNYDFNVIENYTQSVAASTSLSNRIRFMDLPKDEPEVFGFSSFIERQKPHVKQIVSEITKNESNSPRLIGLVLDMFCTPMIDVANDFGLPSYIFFTSSAAFLGFMLHMQVICDEQKANPTELKELNPELVVPSLVNPFPTKVMPSALLGKEILPPLQNFRRFKEVKGIIVNTFFELESYAIESFSDGKVKNLSPLYPVGPILNLGDDGRSKHQEIMQWLDNQPASSVVFLCFGSMGSLSEDQVKEIANALEHSGHRFLWSLRRPHPPTGRMEAPSDYDNPQEVLPEGFLDRMAGIGKVVGWAPQAAILAHEAIGGFVSHCGWNSMLESIWYGVPVAAWPIYGDQQFNAFEMVIEIGLAVEIKMDYRKDSEIIVSCDEIERGIRSVMELDSEKRKKVKQMSERSRMTIMEGGSSYMWLDRLMKDVMDNMS